MNISCHHYEMQVERARETARILEEKLTNLRSKLDLNPEDATYRRELKQLDLDMKITMNEIEHAELQIASPNRLT